jgi:hypothetical protein
MLAGALASPRWDSGEQRLPPGSTIRRERANMTTPSFDVYRLPEEHEAVREAVREVCAAGVARTPPRPMRPASFRRRRTTRCERPI